MKKLFVVSSLFLFLFITNLTSAQQWTDEQKDVWKGVETYWAISASDHPVDFINYIDDSYCGWSNEFNAPISKKDLHKALNYWSKKVKTAYYVITPAKIWVNRNFAYVHYYYSEVFEGNDGKPVTEKGRWTDILIKKDGKWIIVGDHGGETK